MREGGWAGCSTSHAHPRAGGRERFVKRTRCQGQTLPPSPGGPGGLSCYAGGQNAYHPDLQTMFHLGKVDLRRPRQGSRGASWEEPLPHHSNHQLFYHQCLCTVSLVSWVRCPGKQSCTLLFMHTEHSSLSLSGSSLLANQSSCAGQKLNLDSAGNLTRFHGKLRSWDGCHQPFVHWRGH